MSRWSPYIYGWVMGVCFLILSSCGGGRPSEKGNVERPLPVSMADLDSLPAEPPTPAFIKDWTRYQKKTNDFETFAARARMKYRGPDQSHEFVAQIKLRRQEAIWVSISALGGMVSVGRAYLSPDSIQFISYLQRKAWALPLDEAARLLPFPLDYTMIEDLILGLPLQDTAQVQEEVIRGPFFLVKRHGESWHFMDLYDRHTMNLRQSLQQRLDAPFRSRIELRDYKPLGKRWFSHDRAWSFQDGPLVHDLEMEFIGPQFDDPLSFRFSIPSGFEVNP